MAGRTVPAHHRCEFTCKGFLASAWGQRGSHQLAGRTGGEHVSAADPVTYPMGRVPQEVGPPGTGRRHRHGNQRASQKVGPTTLDHLRVDASAAAPHMVGCTDGDRDDSCHLPATPQVVGHTMPPRLSRMFDAQHLRASRRFCFSSRGVYCFSSPCGVVRGFWVVLWGCGFAFLLWVGHGCGVSAVCSRLGPGLTWGLWLGRVRWAA